MRAIETKHNGILFRSRLEARWAIFFDQLRIRWEYEYEGYESKEMGRYLPDFYFPELRFYGEVKPEKICDKRWSSFVNEIKMPLVIFAGTPNMRPMNIYGGGNGCDVIPFVNISNETYGKFWICGGDEDWSTIEPFKSAIAKAHSARFEFATSSLN